jgi:hypothetical protein
MPMRAALNRAATAPMSGGAKGVDFLDFFIRHGEAADGDLVAVDHDAAAGALMEAVVGVREADVEGEMILAVRLHGGWWDVIESLGNLAVSFAEFGTEGAGTASNGVGAEELEPSGHRMAEEKFELPFLFKRPDEDGVAKFQSEGGEGGLELRCHIRSGGACSGLPGRDGLVDHEAGGFFLFLTAGQSAE